MSRSTTIAATLTVALFASAALQAEERTTDEFCEKFAQATETIMRAHQNGHPMSVLLRNADETLSGIPLLLKAYRLAVMEAYSRPRYSTERIQQRVIAEFRDENHLSCLKGMTGK